MSNNPISSHSILDAINGGLIVLDRAGRVVLWNAWMRLTSGITAEGARGKLLAEIFPRRGAAPAVGGHLDRADVRRLDGNHSRA